MTGIQFTQGGQGITTYIGPPTSQPAMNQSPQPTAYQNTKPPSNPQQTYSVQSVPGAVTAILAPASQQTSATSSHTVQIHQSNVQPQVCFKPISKYHIPKPFFQNKDLKGVCCILRSGIECMISTEVKFCNNTNDNATIFIQVTRFSLTKLLSFWDLLKQK